METTYKKRDDSNEESEENLLGMKDFSGEMVDIEGILGDIDKSISLKIDRPVVERTKLKKTEPPQRDSCWC